MFFDSGEEKNGQTSIQFKTGKLRNKIEDTKNKIVKNKWFHRAAGISL